VIEALFPEGVVALRADESLADEPLRPLEAASAGRMSPARLREFALGRACARRALARLGYDEAQIPRSPERDPIWPEGAVGSLTHTEGLCAVAVARRGEILSLGLDAELDTPLSEGAHARITTEADREHLATLAGPPLRVWGKLLFSAKESFYKCYFPLARTRLGFRDAEIRIEPEGGRFEARLVRSDAPPVAGYRSFYGRFAFAPPHVLTAVTLRSDGAAY
jgi:4'-phosphopantetheinyl transferase EntD